MFGDASFTKYFKVVWVPHFELYKQDEGPGFGRKKETTFEENGWSIGGSTLFIGATFSSRNDLVFCFIPFFFLDL